MGDVELLRELNRDIWHVFPVVYAAKDTVAFVELYGLDLIRAGGPTPRVYGFEEFAAETEQWFTDPAARDDVLAIEFRFTERLAAGELASERGVYRITVSRADDTKVFHGRFHTFSRRTDGRWRIVVDYDSLEGGEVTAESFAAAAVADDLEPFGK